MLPDAQVRVVFDMRRVYRIGERLSSVFVEIFSDGFSLDPNAGSVVPMLIGESAMDAPFFVIVSGQGHVRVFGVEMEGAKNGIKNGIELFTVTKINIDHTIQFGQGKRQDDEKYISEKRSNQKKFHGNR